MPGRNSDRDQRLLAASRTRYLTIGAHLRSSGLTANDDDVFYVYQDELVPALEQGIVPSQAELDRRLAAYHQNPNNVRSWEEVLARVRRPR